MATATYTKTGTKATTAAKLDKTVFDQEVTNHELIKQAYVAYMANGRENLARTKTRGLVRGGGRKPWAQKGTGRARFGSTRNQIWVGGGIVFGPSGRENYSKKLPTSLKRQALRQALSLANQAGKLMVIEDLAVKSAKTAELAKLLAKLGADRQALVVVEDKTPELIRASQNLRGVILSRASYLNVFDILNADHIIFSQAGLKLTEAWLKSEKKAQL